VVLVFDAVEKQLDLYDQLVKILDAVKPEL
jgi:hypothetical protein